MILYGVPRISYSIRMIMNFRLFGWIRSSEVSRKHDLEYEKLWMKIFLFPEVRAMWSLSPASSPLFHAFP